MRRGNQTTTYAYDAANQLTSVTARNRATTYAYDAAGRRIEERSGQHSATTAYDAAGRLGAITTTGGEGAPSTETRTHDGNGALVGVAFTGSDDDDDGDAASGATTLMWDTTRSVPQIAVMTTGGTDTNLIYGAGRALALSGTNTTVFSYDSFGSATRSDDDETDLVMAQRYDAFGNPGDSSGSEGLSFGYRGELHTGSLVHLRNRDYDPATGTFTTVDPLDQVPGSPVQNPYSYANNDPLNKVDPLGLRPTDRSFRHGGGTGPTGGGGGSWGGGGPGGGGGCVTEFQGVCLDRAANIARGLQLLTPQDIPIAVDGFSVGICGGVGAVFGLGGSAGLCLASTGLPGHHRVLHRQVHVLWRCSRRVRFSG